MYVEGLDASATDSELPLTPIDVNRWNVQNAFVDIAFAEADGVPIWFRFGRQELLQRSQRLVSPLEWGNTRRNFEGFKLFCHGSEWKIDGWVTRPVNTAAGNGPLSFFDNARDRGDQSRLLSGVFATWTGAEHQLTDLYWLWDREQQAPVTGIERSRHTIGARWKADVPVADKSRQAGAWHAEVEGGYQFGSEAGLDVSAGFVTAGIGRSFAKLPGTPALWFYYDWASGDRDPNDGQNNTFDQLFPLAHAYLGLIDNVGRRNISAFHVRATAKPHKKLALAAQMHWFDLATDTDVLFNVAGLPVGTPGTGSEVGEELDLVATWTFNSNLNIQVGYLWFWNGTFIQNNIPRATATQFYLQTILRY